jgi:hypothetical protein
MEETATLSADEPWMLKYKPIQNLVQKGSIELL